MTPTLQEIDDFVRQKCIAANPDRLMEVCPNPDCQVLFEGPIRLADALLAVGDKTYDEYEFAIEYIVNNWNLRKDDFTEQTEETKRFVYGLLQGN